MVCTQYFRLFSNIDEKKRLQISKKKFEKEGIYNGPIVTETTPFKNFYPTQNYHNDYYDKRYDAPYCNVVIDHKIAKLFQKKIQPLWNGTQPLCPRGSAKIRILNF